MWQSAFSRLSKSTGPARPLKCIFSTGTVVTLAVVLVGTMAVPAHGLLIVPTYTSNVTSLPNAAEIEAGFDYAAQQYELAFPEAITINISVDAQAPELEVALHWGRVLRPMHPAQDLHVRHRA